MEFGIEPWRTRSSAKKKTAIFVAHPRLSSARLQTLWMRWRGETSRKGTLGPLLVLVDAMIIFRSPVFRKSMNLVALLVLVAVCACTAQETVCRRDYNKREDKESQGLEDGGCYMCSAYEGSKLPGYGDFLKMNCQQMW